MATFQNFHKPRGASRTRIQDVKVRANSCTYSAVSAQVHLRITDPERPDATAFLNLNESEARELVGEIQARLDWIREKVYLAAVAREGRRAAAPAEPEGGAE